MLKNQTAFCDLPAYAINKNLLSDIGRHAEKINLVTDDAEIAKKQVDKQIIKEGIADLRIQSQEAPIHPTTLKRQVFHSGREVEIS